MTALTTKTAQSLHDKRCEQMRAKGFHGPLEVCSYPEDQCIESYAGTQQLRWVHCIKFCPSLIPWPDLPESRRQEYLVTAKAVLPEIVGEVFGECLTICAEMNALESWAAIGNLRDRCLEELK